MRKIAIRSWIIWFLAVLFYFYEYFFRVSPSVIVPELMKAFQVNAVTIGFLSGFYFYSYSPMQIPVGLLMDKYGARRLLSFASCICGIGGLMMASAFHIVLAEIGRLCIGVGAAFAFVGLIYVCSHWFPKKKLALMIGLGNSLGMLGGIIGEGPLAIAVQDTGWRQMLYMLSIGGFILAFLIFLFVRNNSSTGSKEKKGAPYTLKDLWENLTLVLKNGYVWLNAIIGFLYFSTTVAFASLWGVPFLTKAYNISAESAGFMMSTVFLGWIVGGPILGHYSDKLRTRRFFLTTSSLITLAILLPVIYIQGLPFWLLYVLLFLVGLFSSTQLLVFSLAIELTPEKAKGTAIAFTNFLVAFGGSIVQPLVGYLLDLRWSGILDQGIPSYSLGDYHFALTFFPLSLILSFVFSCFLKEKKKTN